MDINEQILLWGSAQSKIIDIRRISMKAGERTTSYLVPSGLFLMTIRGSATAGLDGSFHPLKRFTVLHASKGAALDIHAAGEGLDYYSIYYKIDTALSMQQESSLLSGHARSLKHGYSFAPSNPVILHRCLSDMYQDWQKQQPLARLRVKALLLQFVHELLNQMQQQGAHTHKRDLAAQIASIIHAQYAEPITLESLSDSLNYSVPHLSSYFKIRTGLSPIDYLIKVRIDKAAALLLETDATLKEIALGVGYQDPYYLGRLFKKHKGVSPTRYREEHVAKALGEHPARALLEDSPATTMRSSIAAPRPLGYTGTSDNHYQYNEIENGEEDLLMFKHSGPALASVLLLSFMLVLSACGTNNAAGTATTEPSPSASTTPAATEQPQTKIIKTPSGELEVPAHPQRIVAGEYLGSLIALGVTPVATSDHHIKNPYFQEYLKNVENIGDGNGNVEKILAMEPDLIIMDDFYPELNEQMSKIAPTVVVPYASLKTVHEEVAYFGELLGREQEAEAWLADYDSRIAAAKESVLNTIPADSTFSVMELEDKSIMTVGTDFGKGGQPIYNGFGFKPPAEIAAEMADPGWASISAEALPVYAGDFIVLTSNKQTLDDLKADPIWSTLPAVKNNHVFIWSSDRSNYWDPIAILSQTEELAAWLTSL
jgi:iron complex transport system substrate-binding protein